ncbi:MAG: hypothetical protein ACTSR2_01625 [Candidatus Hodarchaeales archaeon]
MGEITSEEVDKLVSGIVIGIGISIVLSTLREVVFPVILPQSNFWKLIIGLAIIAFGAWKFKIA